MDGWSESNSLATAISKHLDLFVKSVWVFVEIIRNLISCQTSIMFSCLLAGIRLMISSRSFTSHFINMETGRVPQFWYSYFREAITAFHYITKLKDRPKHYQPFIAVWWKQNLACIELFELCKKPSCVFSDCLLPLPCNHIDGELWMDNMKCCIIASFT